VSPRRDASVLPRARTIRSRVSQKLLSSTSEGHEPTGRMAALLNLLGPRCQACREPLDETNSPTHGDHSPAHTTSWLTRLQRFTAWSCRSRPVGTVAPPSLSSGGRTASPPVSRRPIRPSFGSPSLESSTRLSRVDGYDDYQSRLAIIWLALRELMGERPNRGSGDHLCTAGIRHSPNGRVRRLGTDYRFCLMGCLGAISSRSRICEK